MANDSGDEKRFCYPASEFIGTIAIQYGFTKNNLFCDYVLLLSNKMCFVTIQSFSVFITIK